MSKPSVKLALGVAPGTLQLRCDGLWQSDLPSRKPLSAVGIQTEERWRAEELRAGGASLSEVPVVVAPDRLSPARVCQNGSRDMAIKIGSPHPQPQKACKNPVICLVDMCVTPWRRGGTLFATTYAN